MILLQGRRGWSGPHSLGDTFFVPWTWRLLYAFPPPPLIPRVINKIKHGKVKMAQTDLVSLPYNSPSCLSRSHSSIHSSSPFSRCWMNVSPQPEDYSSQSLAPRWTTGLETSCFEVVQQVLMNSRKESTRFTYLHDWERYSIRCDQRCSPPAHSSSRLFWTTF